MTDISKIKNGPFCPYFGCYCDEDDCNKCKECSFYKEIVEFNKRCLLKFAKDDAKGV